MLQQMIDSQLMVPVMITAAGLVASLFGLWVAEKVKVKDYRDLCREHVKWNTILESTLRAEKEKPPVAYCVEPEGTVKPFGPIADAIAIVRDFPCRQCGKQHRISMHPLRVPSMDHFTHWGKCHETGTPVLARITVGTEQSLQEARRQVVERDPIYAAKTRVEVAWPFNTVCPFDTSERVSNSPSKEGDEKLLTVTDVQLQAEADKLL